LNAVYGLHPVAELLRSQAAVDRIFLVEEPNEKQRELAQAARKQGILVEILPREEFRQRFGPKAQGVAAYTVEVRTLEVDEWLGGLSARPDSLLLVLDQVQDPQNLGALLRTAEAAGVEGVAVSLHGSAPFTPVVYKASAGAVSHLRLTQAPSLNWLLEQLKSKGYWLAGADARKGEDYQQVKLAFPLALLLGSEGWGVRPLLLRRCDFLLRIPLYGKVSSLNVSVAGGILLFELRHLQQSGTATD
jgi:23S rRNA (guanosine2251-2'-O)-methyltransferase